MCLLRHFVVWLFTSSRSCIEVRPYNTSLKGDLKDRERICESLWWSKQSWCWCSGRTLRRCWGVSTLSLPLFTYSAATLHPSLPHFCLFLLTTTSRNRICKILFPVSPHKKTQLTYGACRLFTRRWFRSTNQDLAKVWSVGVSLRLSGLFVYPILVFREYCSLFGREGKWTFGWGVGSGMLLLGASESISFFDGSHIQP